MKFHTDYLTFNTKEHRAYVHITPQVEKIVKDSGIENGLVLVSAMHITAGVYVNRQRRRPDSGHRRLARGACALSTELPGSPDGRGQRI